MIKPINGNDSEIKKKELLKMDRNINLAKDKRKVHHSRQHSPFAVIQQIFIINFIFTNSASKEKICENRFLSYGG